MFYNINIAWKYSSPINGITKDMDVNIYDNSYFHSICIFVFAICILVFAICIFVFAICIFVFAICIFVFAICIFVFVISIFVPCEGNLGFSGFFFV